MHKILAFLVLLMLPWTVRGQALADWYYWFDTDAAPRDSGKVSAQQFQLQTDVSHLPTGAHTLYVQVADTAGVFSPPLGKFFFKVPDVSSIDKLFYTIDTEKEAHAVNFGNGSFSLDVSTYPVGFHSINLQVMDKEGGISSVMPYLFYKVPADGRLSRFRYWFDNDRTILEQPYGQGHYLLNVSELIPGLHFVNFFVIDGANNMTDVQSAAFFRQPVVSNQKLYYWLAGDTVATQVDNFLDGFVIDVSKQMEGFNTIYFQLEDNGTTDIQTEHFIKIPQTEGAGDMTVLCIIDGKIASEEKLPNLGGVIKWDMNVSTMDVGMHKALFQVITPSGSGSSIAESYFLRTLTNDEVATMQCSYIIDGFKHYVQKGISTNGTFHFDLPVDDMEDGLHRMDYMLVAENGVTTTQGSAWFFKTPVGGNGITQYDYWLNSKSDEVQSVTLDSPTDPFQLIKLLPVSAEPIRTACFHFDVKDGQPMIYAKNDIHFRFHDKSGRWVDADNQYVDYNVGQEVTDVEWLEPGVRATTAKPAENTIKWYCLEAEPGDSLQFKLDRAATIQLFAPSGKEVFSTSGSESVKWCGLHVTETGTYYLALHDVTATQGTTISLDYNHIDRYAVLRQDVSVVGNGGCNTITFEGNGFDELLSVDLVSGSETISSIEVGHESNATTSVTFDFTDAELGQYKAVFHFADDDLVLENCVKVEESTGISIDLAATFNKSYLVAFHKTDYVFSVHNNGNMTAYNVPLLIRFYTHNAESLDKVYVKGYDLKKDYMKLFGEHYTDSMDVAINEKMAASGDRCFFLEADSTDIVAGWAAHVHQAFLFPNIPPNSTKEFTVSLELGQSVYCYMWCPDDWDEGNECAPRANAPKKAGSAKCGKDLFFHESHCAQNAMLHQAGEPLAYNEDCMDYKPYPLPCPGGGGSSSPVSSFDPNEIYGYTAESGSKAVMDGLTDVYYTVQFENEAEYATAAAHEIVVTDTLDATCFDLSTYAPTRVAIGEKSAELTGDKNFVTTVDMRPEINAIAQVEGTYDQQKGIAKWHITSLDPMTMEPTDDPMDGVLPVNTNGNGIGEVSYNISLKPNLAHGTEVNNRAGIVFDQNEMIMTPTWTNIIDRIAPESHIQQVMMENDTVMTLKLTGSDECSGVWRYNVYVQAGEDAPWWLTGENVTDSVFRYTGAKGVNYGFCVVATDSAGNVETKTLAREVTVNTITRGDANDDKVVNAIDAVLVINYYLGVPGTFLNFEAADVVKDDVIDAKDVVAIQQIYLNTSNTNNVKRRKYRKKP